MTVKSKGIAAPPRKQRFAPASEAQPDEPSRPTWTQTRTEALSTGRPMDPLSYLVNQVDRRSIRQEFDRSVRTCNNSQTSNKEVPPRNGDSTRRGSPIRRFPSPQNKFRERQTIRPKQRRTISRIGESNTINHVPLPMKQVTEQQSFPSLRHYKRQVFCSGCHSGLISCDANP